MDNDEIEERPVAAQAVEPDESAAAPTVGPLAAGGRDDERPAAAAVEGEGAAFGAAPAPTPSEETPDVPALPADADPSPVDDDLSFVASAEIKAIVEALIFASPEPLSKKALAKLLDSEPKEDVEAALAALKIDYERPGGLQLVEVAGGYQIVTRPDLHEWVRRLFHEHSTQKLSAQALETLAVIAYRQPVTAAEITEIRGVNTSGVLNTLLERHLVKIVGRKAVVGRPFMYATTREFLIRFGLNDLSDLPRVQDMVDALGLEAPILVEQNLGEDELPLDEPDEEVETGAPDADASSVSAAGAGSSGPDGAAG